MRAEDKIRALNVRRQSTDRQYQDVRPIFQEIRDAMLPTRGRFSVGEERRGTGVNKRIIDNAARRGVRILRSGLKAGMTSPSRPWFRLGPHDRAIMNEPGVQQFYADAQELMFEVFRGSNIYSMFDHAYTDLALFGTFGGLIMGDYEDVIRTQTFPVGSFLIAENERDEVDVMHWGAMMTAEQIVGRWGAENVSNEVYRAYKNNTLRQPFEVCFAVEPRRKRDPMSKLKTDMPVAFFAWEKSATSKLLEEGGFETENVLAPRWETTAGEVWATNWPALEALGDTIQLQVQHRDKAQAIQYSYKPPMIAQAGLKKRFRNIPGGVTTLNTTDLQRGGLRPAVEVRPDVTALLGDINETRQRIRESFFEDLFLLISNDTRSNITATEIAARQEEKLLVLGPVLESLDRGLLHPVIQATFHYMQEAGLLPEPPAVLEGTPVKVEYISLLAQAQKAVGVAAIERTIGFIGSLAQVNPEVIDNLNPDETLREFVGQVGPPPNMLRDKDEVAAIRESRAEREQTREVLGQAEPLANAAKLISEANQRGQEGLARAVPL
ncbi:MAG: portal protein [Pseudomonadota bacterium]